MIDGICIGHRGQLTNIQHQSFRRGFDSIDLERLHTTHDRADEVDIKDGININHVKQNGDGQEGQAPDPRHGEEERMREID